jgi:DNA-binding NarL/FixJ family response regulator
LIGRQREFAVLVAAFAALREGKGGVLLVAGEAGAGKTRLVEAALSSAELIVLTGRATVQTTPPYGPIVAALRSYLRQAPGGLTHDDPLSQYLPLILPELGSAPASSDPAVLVEALRDAFELVARRQPAVVFLDDLQWADNATFDLLPRLAESLAHQPILVIGTYRSDEIPRGHPMRQLRTELRRLRQLHEVVVEPLDRHATAELAAGAFGSPLSSSLASALYDRTQGIPLFIEELANALSTSRYIRAGQSGLELIPGHDVPIPETLRDAVLLRLDGLSAPARKLLEVAAVLGLEFDPALAGELAEGEEALDELFERNWIAEANAGRAVFRHALTHEAIYNQIPWTRRRTWHRDVAMLLAAQNAPPEILAEHWLAAREPDLARQALLEFARKSCSVHAYRDAAGAIQRALELWPRGVEEARRLEVLDQLGYCSQLSGLLNDAIRAWREVVEYRQYDSDKRILAQVQRQLATAYELQGAWEQVLAARQAAAEAFSASAQPEEAATERVSAAAHLRSAGRFRSAMALLSVARDEVAPGQRWDLKARIMGLEGNVRARMGEFEPGLSMVRAGLVLALEHELSAPTAEVYQRLADALEHAGDYAGAKDTYQTAFDFCQMNAAPTTGQVCMACLTAVLFHVGEWERASVICRDVMASADSPLHALTVSNCILGLIYALRGQANRARPLLLEASAMSRRVELAACELLSTWGVALLDEYNQAHESAAEHCRSLLQRWQQIQELHYAISPLRWATTRFAALKASTETRACANALASIASITGQPEALSALAHALGEVAVLDGDDAQAVRQFEQSLQLLQNVDSPLESAETHLRLGSSLLAVGKREPAIEHLVHAYRAAEKLGAKPLADEAAQKLAALGEQMDRRLGRRAAGKLQQGGLTRRQLEILQLVAQGRTNLEIADALSVSPRTVEMHVGDILARLDCHTRTEAVRKASELSLLKIP